MASRSRQIDMGPMYLPVGQDEVSQSWPAPRTSVQTGDVARFESLLKRDKGHQHHDVEMSPEALLATLRDPEPEPFGETGDIAAEVAHLWVGTGLRSGREVRVGLGQALLPDTAIHMFEASGLLRIEFTCATHRVASWLQRQLKALTSELGERLGRELELSVSMRDGSLVGCRTWRRAA
ncbi:MAG: hypothetical protein H7238_12410 [Polaromonas sp.]|nr:hypothetical protein [Polaromonas sp.]